MSKHYLVKFAGYGNDNPTTEVVEVQDDGYNALCVAIDFFKKFPDDFWSRMLNDDVENYYLNEDDDVLVLQDEDHAYVFIFEYVEIQYL